jgi:hypothetical protein
MLVVGGGLIECGVGCNRVVSLFITFEYLKIYFSRTLAIFKRDIL